MRLSLSGLILGLNFCFSIAWKLSNIETRDGIDPITNGAELNAQMEEASAQALAIIQDAEKYAGDTEKELMANPEKSTMMRRKRQTEAAEKLAGNDAKVEDAANSEAVATAEEGANDMEVPQAEAVADSIAKEDSQQISVQSETESRDEAVAAVQEEVEKGSDAMAGEKTVAKRQAEAQGEASLKAQSDAVAKADEQIQGQNEELISAAKAEAEAVAQADKAEANALEKAVAGAQAEAVAQGEAEAQAEAEETARQFQAERESTVTKETPNAETNSNPEFAAVKFENEKSSDDKSPDYKSSPESDPVKQEEIEVETSELGADSGNSINAEVPLSEAVQFEIEDIEGKPEMDRVEEINLDEEDTASEPDVKEELQIKQPETERVEANNQPGILQVGNIERSNEPQPAVEQVRENLNPAVFDYTDQSLSDGASSGNEKNGTKGSTVTSMTPEMTDGGIKGILDKKIDLLIGAMNYMNKLFASILTKYDGGDESGPAHNNDTIRFQGSSNGSVGPSDKSAGLGGNGGMGGQGGPSQIGGEGAFGGSTGEGTKSYRNGKSKSSKGNNAVNDYNVNSVYGTDDYATYQTKDDPKEYQEEGPTDATHKVTKGVSNRRCGKGKCGGGKKSLARRRNAKVSKKNSFRSLHNLKSQKKNRRGVSKIVKTGSPDYVEDTKEDEAGAATTSPPQNETLSTTTTVQEGLTDTY